MAYRGRTQHDLYSSREPSSYNATESHADGSDWRSPSSSDREIWKGLVSGLIAGAAATWALTQYQVHAPKLFQKINSSQPESKPEVQQQQNAENPTVTVAHKISETVRGRKVSEQHKDLAGNLVHYGFGTLNGGLFGMLSEIVNLPAPLHGLIFGSGLWGVADELVLPATGLAKWWPEYPLSVHLNALGAHLVYGSTMGVAHSGIRRLLGHREQWAEARSADEWSTKFRAPRVHPRKTETNYSVNRYSRFEAGEEQPIDEQIRAAEQEARRIRREERRQERLEARRKRAA